MNVVLLDFWSERNRGDEAMQRALLGMVRDSYANANITICLAYGGNQLDYVKDEFGYASQRARIIGGMRPTFAPLSPSFWCQKRPARVLADVSACLWAFFVMFLASLRLPKSILRLLIPKSGKAAFDAIAEADLVIWNGRNFRSSYGIKEPIDIISLVYQPVIAARLGKPVACLGASLWPLKQRLSQTILRRAFEKTILTSFREENSFSEAKGLLGELGDRYLLLPDLSFYVLREFAKEPRPVRKPEARPQIGLTVVDWYGDGIEVRQRYIDSIIALVKHVRDDLGGDVIVLPQVSYSAEQPTAITDQIQRALGKDSIQIREGDLTIEELVNAYKGLDCLIATRMHSAIFALSIGTPVLAIAYDWGGKWGILKMMGAGRIVHDLPHVSPESILRAFDELWQGRDAFIRDLQAPLQYCFDHVDDHITITKRRVDQSGGGGLRASHPELAKP